MRRKTNRPEVAPDDVLLTVADFAKRCQVSEGTVRRWIAEGRLKIIRLGRLIRISRSDIIKFLNQNS